MGCGSSTEPDGHSPAPDIDSAGAPDGFEILTPAAEVDVDGLAEHYGLSDGGLRRDRTRTGPRAAGYPPRSTGRRGQSRCRRRRGRGRRDAPSPVEHWRSGAGRAAGTLAAEGVCDQPRRHAAWTPPAGGRTPRTRSEDR